MEKMTKKERGIYLFKKYGYLIVFGVCALVTDFSCEDGSNVLSVANGTVEEVGNNYLRGNYVVINHGNNLKSVYGSLGDNVSVKVGQNVSKGDVIGTAGKTAHSELSAGTHLHFEMLDNDKKIDPSGYLMLENK